MEKRILHIDIYSKIVLTIIAACLIWISVNNINFTQYAYAEPEIQNVRIVGIDKSLFPLKTTVSNDYLTVKFEKYPVDVLINDPNYYKNRE